MSAQDFLNPWQDFYETIQEWSLPSLVVHIGLVFRPVEFSLYGPWKIFKQCIFSGKDLLYTGQDVCETSQKWSVQSLVLHIVVMFCSGRFLLGVIALWFFKCVRNPIHTLILQFPVWLPLKNPARFQWNFTGVINSMTDGHPIPVMSIIRITLHDRWTPPDIGHSYIPFHDNWTSDT